MMKKNSSEKQLSAGQGIALATGLVALSLSAAFFIAANPPGSDNTLDQLPSTLLEKQPEVQPAPTPTVISPREQSIAQLTTLAQKQTPTRSDVRTMQRLLTKLDYNPGKADGVFYQKTAKAFAAFLKDNPEKTNLLSGWIFERLMFQKQRMAVMNLAGNNPAVKQEIETRLAAAKKLSTPDAIRMQAVYAMALPAKAITPAAKPAKPAPVVKPVPKKIEPRTEKPAPDPKAADRQASAAPAVNPDMQARAKELAENSRFIAALKNKNMLTAIRIMHGEPAGPVRLMHPVKNATISSGFKYRHGRLHRGVDYPVPKGTPVMASADGIVMKIETRNKNGEPGGYGRSIAIDHGSGVYTLYAHLSRKLVQPGAKVHAGQQIASSGNSGYSKGAHLHFEVHARNGTGDRVAVNPQKIVGRDMQFTALDSAGGGSITRPFRSAALATVNYSNPYEQKPALNREDTLLLIAVLREKPSLMNFIHKSAYREMIAAGCRDELVALSRHADACLRQNHRRPDMAFSGQAVDFK